MISCGRFSNGSGRARGATTSGRNGMFHSTVTGTATNGAASNGTPGGAGSRGSSSTTGFSAVYSSPVGATRKGVGGRFGPAQRGGPPGTPSAAVGGGGGGAPPGTPRGRSSSRGGGAAGPPTTPAAATRPSGSIVHGETTALPATAFTDGGAHSVRVEYSLEYAGLGRREATLRVYLDDAAR